MKFTRENVAEHIASSIVSAVVSSTAKRVLVDHTDMNPDGHPVKIMSGSIGLIVANQTTRYTDPLVAKAFARYDKFKADRKKNAETK